MGEQAVSDEYKSKLVLFANILIDHGEARQYGIRTHSKARLMGIRKKLLGY